MARVFRVRRSTITDAANLATAGAGKDALMVAATSGGSIAEGDILVANGVTVQKGYGYYLEDYEKGQDGRWRIKSLTLGYFHIEK